jgi:dynein heavy chain
MPPVAGNILWSRHLLKRIEEPMTRFEAHRSVLATKDSRKIVKSYNKVARTLVAFEYLWYEAWCRSVENAKSGLQATLIIRHPSNGKLYVNFDPEIMQLIREAKCLARMQVEVPESARMVLLQEGKFKLYHQQLSYALAEYDRVMAQILPVLQPLLRPHVADLECKLRPGMVTLTWTSMNIDAFLHSIHSGLSKLESLNSNINDIIEHRIEKNLKLVSKALLVELPNNRSFALDEFVLTQERFVKEKTVVLQAKNWEIETAVRDLVAAVCGYTLDPAIAPVEVAAIQQLTRHYNRLMYQALLNSSKNSLNSLKERVCSRGGGTGFLFIQRPFFEVDVQLAVPSVRLSPTLDDIQRAVNKGALAVLRVTKQVWEWQQAENVPDEQKASFFDRVRVFFGVLACWRVGVPVRVCL